MRHCFRPSRACLVLGFLLSAASAAAQEAPRTAPIRLEVDASEVTRRIVHTRLEIPVRPGPLTLFYPKWIPGNHSPSGPITDLAGLKIRAGNSALPWQRDEVDPYALHLTIPEGVTRLDVALDYLINAGDNSSLFSSPVTARLAVLSWDQVLLYPKGPPTKDLTFQASLRLPRGWQHGSALNVTKEQDGVVHFEPVSLEMLIDSPVLCGRHFRKVALAPRIQPPHYLALAGDSEEAVNLPEEMKAKYDRLVEEAMALFGCHHYRHYYFLLALSDHIPHGGLEHHECSDNKAPERLLHDAAIQEQYAALLSHEMVHSWNGKYRRPAKMITRDFQEPQRTRLLWVYEGLTNYLGEVLAARSGLRSLADSRDELARVAEAMRNQKGRAWRPLEDTTVAAQLLYSAPATWGSWRRGVDFYDDGTLIWLDVDTLIRELTHGRKSLDDFCRDFFNGHAGPSVVKGYRFDDVVTALTKVVPHDWKGLLLRRVSVPSERAPLNGISRGGWKLTYGDKRSSAFEDFETVTKVHDLTSSIGLLLKEDGAVADVIKGGAAARAGIGPGMKLVAVNGRRWTEERLRDAVAATRHDKKLELLIENDEFFRTFTLDYHDGARYPLLERTSESQPDLLSAILQSRTTEAKDRK